MDFAFQFFSDGTKGIPILIKKIIFTNIMNRLIRNIIILISVRASYSFYCKK